jgi:hypothetical protein
MESPVPCQNAGGKIFRGFRKASSRRGPHQDFPCEKCGTTEKLRVLKKGWETVERIKNHA